MQKLPELPFRLPAAALQRAASQAISVAESLRAPDRGMSKLGSAGGHKLIGTKQHYAQKVSFHTRPRHVACLSAKSKKVSIILAVIFPYTLGVSFSVY